MSLVGFALAAGATDLDDVARATLLADRMLFGQDWVRRTAFGIGLATDPNKVLCMMILADQTTRMHGLEGDGPRPLSEVRELYAAISRLFSSSEKSTPPPWLGRVWVTPTLPPELHAAASEDVSSSPSGRSGKIGTNVTWSGGAGYLVAGHVADQPPGASARDNAGNSGTVNYRCDPSGQGNSILDDVAVVDFGTTAKRFTSLATNLGPNTVVTVQTSRNGKPYSATTTIKGALKYSFFNAQNGTWGELYYCSPLVTHHGDSGAPVELKQALVGHVVAGSSYTYIQDAVFQLKQIRSKSSSTHGNINL
jgi:hypothetical protein